MPNRSQLEQGTGAAIGEPFITIDDCISSAQELVQSLNRLGAQKRPLDVRKGIHTIQAQRENSKTLKAPSRTYFFDIKTLPSGGRYLVVTESRVKDKYRSQITVFPEDARRFLASLEHAVFAMDQ